MNTTCQVHQCTEEAAVLHTLRERQGWLGYPMEFAVCEPHRDLLSRPDTEWVLSNDTTGRVLRVGESLQELNEYILMEAPTTVTGYGAGRDFSHREHNGHHIPLKVRRRGDATATEMTLVVPFEKMADFVHLLQLMVPTP